MNHPSPLPSPSPARWRFAPAFVYVGAVLQVIGLLVYIQLGQPDAALVSTENLFSYSNPGQLIFATGLLLVILGAVLSILPGASWAPEGRGKRLVTALPALLLAGLAAGGLAYTAQTRDTTGGHGHDATSDSPNILLVEQLAEARSATAKYADISVARAEGFATLSVDLPGSGVHMVKPERIGDGVKLDEPEMLLYTWNGSQWQFLGVAYVETGSADGISPPDGFAGDADVWHQHDRACLAPSGLVLAVDGTMTSATCAASGGSYEAGTGGGQWALHVWLGLPNAGGYFGHDHTGATGSLRVPSGDNLQGAAPPGL